MRSKEARLQEDKTKRARQFVEALPHSRALGMELISVGSGTAELSMPYDPSLVGDSGRQVIFGGAVSALMDTCCGLAVFAHEDTVVSTATLDLRIDYMRPATPGQGIRAEATCYHMTRNVAFVRAHAYDDDAEKPVAAASGAFTLNRAETVQK